MADTPSAEDKSRYDLARRELALALARKRQLDKSLTYLEVQIHNFETTYLSETANNGGNIIQGLDGYLKNVPAGRKKHDVSDNDRIFSTSSKTYLQALELSREADESAGDEHTQSRSGSQLMTVVVPPARQDSGMSNKKGKDNKKKRPRTTVVSDDESVVSTSTTRKSHKRSRLADDD